jgi:hypothetical protein
LGLALSYLSLGGRLLTGHLGIEREEFFEAIAVVFAVAIDVDEIAHLVVAIASRCPRQIV